MNIAQRMLDMNAIDWFAVVAGCVFLALIGGRCIAFVISLDDPEA